MKAFLLSVSLALAGAAGASAQTLGTVFGPNVDPGDREVSYRFAVESADGLDEDLAFGQRLHYQQALGEALRWRALIAYDDPVGGDLELDYVQGELLWQFIESGPGGWTSALRFDGRIREGDDLPHEIGLNWTNQWALPGDWRVRGLILVDREVGARSEDDWFFETRASLSRRLASGPRITLEMFNDFGGIDAGFGDFDDQSHQLGPVIGTGLGDSWEISGGVLFGVSEAAPDQDFVLRLTRPL